MNAQDEIILLLSPVNNHSQNIENLAYFETVLKTLLDEKFNSFFQEILKEKTLKTPKINKCTVSNKNAQARFSSKK